MNLRSLLIICCLFICTNAMTQEVNHDQARIDYILHCQGCHLPDGSGVQDSVPSMNGYVGNFLKVNGGREYLIRVPGSAYSDLSDG